MLDVKDLQDYNRHRNDWHIRQDIEEDNIELANKIAVDAIAKGADIIGFNANKVANSNQL